MQHLFTVKLGNRKLNDVCFIYAGTSSSLSTPAAATGARKEVTDRPLVKQTKGKGAVSRKSGAIPKVTRNIKPEKGMLIQQTMGAIVFVNALSRGTL